MALLNVRNLGKRTSGKWALWDVDLEIKSAEILGILGRSGSGKTTLARVLAGLDQPTNGTVTVGDDMDPAQSRISVALSTPAFAPELTVYENLNLFAALWGMSARRRMKEIVFLLELLGLSEWRTTPAARLSSGALRRLEIARSLLAESPMLVIDSLLDTLDPDILERLWEHMLSLRRTELKSFLVLTASGRIAEMCSRLAVMHQGRIGFLGRPDDFRRLAGEDLVVLGGGDGPALRNRLQERLSIIIKEEDGFLSFRVANGEKIVNDLMTEFGGELGCVYLKRPTLEDALEVLASGSTSVVAGPAERKSN